MPRIDPLQLLECLAILLAPNGGIKGTPEVKRISSLMLKFSKKLVSKCIYIQILKCSETLVLGQFMEAGGWMMTFGWLEDAVNTENYPLIQEILELFLLCPVDAARLRSNAAPKLVKQLHRGAKHDRVKILSTRLCEQWLKVVRGEHVVYPATTQQQDQLAALVDPSDPSGVVYQSAATAAAPQPQQSNMQLLDPGHPSYTDSLAMAGDELGGLGSLGAGDIDVDEIIPTMNLAEVGGGFFNGLQLENSSAVPIVDQDGQELVEEVDDGTNGEGTVSSSTGHRPSNGIGSSSSSSSNNNMSNQKNPHQSSHRNNTSSSSLSNDKTDVMVAEGGEKEALKIKIITLRDGQAKVSSSSKDDVVDSSTSGGSASGKSKSSSSSSSRSEKKSSSSSSSSRDKDKDRKSSKSSSSSSSSGHHKSSSSSSSSKRSHSSSSKSSSSSSSRDKDKERSSSSRSHSSSSKSSSSSSSTSASRSSKEAATAAEKQAEKDKDTLNKVMGGSSVGGVSSIEKLGKIPKKPRTEGDAPAPPPTKKPSMSIEVRKDPENRPKTVKTFNSQFRDHGLVADIPPPPSRKTLKKQDSVTTAATTAATTTTTTAIAKSGLKRASPTKEGSSASPSVTSPVSEKRQKLDQIVATAAAGDEKPGGVKLIAPRAKPTLIESDMFMDALCSSAPAKGNAKKRKRIASTNSKEGSPPPTPESPKIIAAPMKFYQDTLEEKVETNGKTEDSVANAATDDAAESQESPSKRPSLDTDDTPASPSAKDTPTSPGKSPSSPDNPTSPTSDTEKPAPGDAEDMEVDEDVGPRPPGPGCGPDGPPGVLVIHRRRGAKKSVRWRAQEELEEVRLFELDETERVNVTKTFTDMKQMERFGERDAFQMARKLQNDDIMVEQTPWTALIEVDDVPVTADGAQSKERTVQAARELTCLQALYFNYTMVPDSPAEADTETHKYAEPALIPLEDAQNTVNDFTKQGWPEPKEYGAGGGGNGVGGMFNGGMPGPFDNPFGQPPPFGMNPNMQPFGVNNGIWNGPGGGGGVAPFAPGPGNGLNMNSEEIKLAMNRLAFPGQTFNPPNFNGINVMNLPAMGAGGPMGGGQMPPQGGGPPNGGPWGFRGAPPMGGQWRNHGPQNNWINNNNNGNNRGPPCKNFKKGFCKKGDKCGFSHATGGPGGFRN